MREERVSTKWPIFEFNKQLSYGIESLYSMAMETESKSNGWDTQPVTSSPSPLRQYSSDLMYHIRSDDESDSVVSGSIRNIQETDISGSNEDGLTEVAEPTEDQAQHVPTLKQISSGKRVQILEDILICPGNEFAPTSVMGLQHITAELSGSEEPSSQFLNEMFINLQQPLSQRCNQASQTREVSVEPIGNVDSDCPSRNTSQIVKSSTDQAINSVQNHIAETRDSAEPKGNTLSVNDPVKVPNEPIFRAPLPVGHLRSNRRRTRSSTNDTYNDHDAEQNELINMEGAYADSEPGPVGSPQAELPVSKDAQMKQWRFECERSKLPPPLPYHTYEAMEWKLVTTLDRSLLKPGQTLSTLVELKEIPRRHTRFPFCRPGPVVDAVSGSRDWYYADSIIQKIEIVGTKISHYVVRWIGYEDEYNTLEPESNVRGSAVLILFERDDIYTASQATGPSVLRRSTRSLQKAINSFMAKSVSQNESYARAMVALDDALRVEEQANNYIPEIGFCSSVNTIAALTRQVEFTEQIFMKIIQNLQRPHHFVSPKYLGNFFGSFQSKDLLENFEYTAYSRDTTVTKIICNGLNQVTQDDENTKFAHFIVATKRHGKEKANDKCLNLHMCVYTIRDVNGTRDGVYFDPAPPCHSRTVPDFLYNLRKPQLRSAAIICGDDTQTLDCYYRCLKHIIGLQTGELKFEPNLESKYFKIKKLKKI